MTPLPPQPSARSTPLPVTLVSGFLGAGKTLLVAHELRAHPERATAALVMGSTTFCPDAGVLRAQLAPGQGSQVIEVRDDDPQHRWQDFLPEAVNMLAQSEAVDHLVIEVSGRLQIQALLKVLPAAEPGFTDHQLSARIHHIVCVIDGLDFYHRVVRPTNATQTLPNTPLQRLLASQARAATHVVVNKVDLLSEDQVRETFELLKLINPMAQFAMSSFGQVPPQFLEAAAPKIDTPLETGPLPNIPGPKETSLLPPTYTRAVLFQARRPFHPARFWKLCGEDWPPVMRAKGYFWLASRMDGVGVLSQSFAAFSCAQGGHWWATLARDLWPEEGPDREKLEDTWQEPFGDRRQELLIEGEPGPVSALQEALRGCLLNDVEMDQGPRAWERYDDPWPEWELETEDGDDSPAG